MTRIMGRADAPVVTASGLRCERAAPSVMKPIPDEEAHVGSFDDSELDRPFELGADAIRRFRERGFVVLRGFFSRELLEHYEGEISALVGKLNRNLLPMEERPPYFQAFIQVTNLWRESEPARRFALNRRCARAATELLGTRGVRMYHDQALYKEPGGGITPWHADQFYWPLASERSVTAWIPLQDTPVDMGPLCFSEGSHLFDVARDLPIGPESEERIAAFQGEVGLPESEAPYALGDVSFHWGWTLHRARANTTSRMRRAMTMIYVDSEMRLAEPRDGFQRHDRETWCPGVQVGRVIDSPLNPVLYEEER